MNTNTSENTSINGNSNWQIPISYKQCEMTIRNLNFENSLKEGNIYFEKFKHRIFVNKETNLHETLFWPNPDELQGVKGFIKFMFHEVPTEKIAWSIAHSRNIQHNEKYKFLISWTSRAETAQNIVDYWDICHQRAGKRGIELHNIFYTFFKNGHFPNNVGLFKQFSNELPQFRDFLINFIYVKKLSPFILEQSIVSEKYPIFGAFDALFRDKQGHFILMDWKINNAGGDISIDNWSSKNFCKGPFQNMPSTTINMHFVQQNMYRYILKEYGIQIHQMYLIVFSNKSNENYRHYEVPMIDESQLEESIQWMLKKRQIPIDKEKDFLI